jgi:regulatory protein YycI of two-component signal transduction system YycFG
MDWSKAKNIILAVLILTNLFLLGVYGHRYMKEHSQDDDDVYKYTMSVLRENNIYYEGEIYNKSTKLHPLTVSYGKYDANIVNNAISNMRKIPEEDRNEAEYRDVADSLLQKCGFMTENVQEESIYAGMEKAVVSYGNYYKDIPVEECYMNVYFDDGKIVDFERKWIEIVSVGDARVEVTSQLSALLKFMTENEDKGKTVVNDMHLVYWIDDYDVGGDVLYDTALPAWCIDYNNGETKYISATVQ